MGAPGQQIKPTSAGHSAQHGTGPVTAGDDSAPRGRRLAKVLGLLAMLAAVAFVTALGVRPVSSPDLGYHLAYGEETLATGRPVDHNSYIYTLQSIPADNRPEPGPGCWYDDQGRYRFANANWLTQVAMALAYRWGGSSALSLLAGGMVLGIAILSLGSMRRLGVPPAMAAAGLVLIGLTAYERFLLRPELFGYLMLAAELYLLLGKRLTWPVVAALVLIQLLLVNLHSYFMLGVALTGAMLADRVARALWAKYVNKAATTQERQALAAQVKMFAILLAAQAAVSFVNPWTWRLAILPFQTLLFISQNSINAGTPDAVSGHPWAIIGEFFRPLARRADGSLAFFHSKATYAYMVMLGLGSVAALTAGLKRRWDMLMIISGMIVMSLSMRRNIAPAAMMVVPVAIGVLWSLLAAMAARLKVRGPAWLGTGAAAAVAVAAAIFLLTVVTQKFYYWERSPTRFGLGLSRLEIPLGSCQWLNEHAPQGRIWTDYNDSSNIYYFTRPHRDIPVLTNTWAFPPDIMGTVLAYTNAAYQGIPKPFAEVAKEYGLQIVALKVDQASAPLVRQLEADGHWKLVYLDLIHVVFVRDDGPNAALAKASLTSRNLDLAAYKRALRESDPVPAYSLFIGAMTLSALGWDDQAIDVLEEANELDGTYAQAWNMLGIAHATRANMRVEMADRAGARKDFFRARECFENAMSLRSDLPEVAINLELVKKQIRTYFPGE